MNATPLLRPERVEQVHPNILCELFNDGSLIVYKVSAMSREILEAWAEIVARVQASWPKDRVYLALYDLSVERVALPYLTLAGEHFFGLGQPVPAGVYGRIALVFSLNASGHLGYDFVSRLTLAQTGFEGRVFVEREAAMRWLSGGLVKSQGE